MLGRAGVLERGRGGRAARGASTRSRRARAGDVRLRRRRRGRPHGDRAPPDRARRPGRRASSTPRARATTRSRPTWRCSCATSATRARGSAASLMRALLDARRAPLGLADARLHAPPARAARLPLASPARVLLDVPARRRALCGCARRDRRAAARRRRARRRELEHEPRRASPRELGFDGVCENSLDAVSNRDFVLDYLSAASICAMHLSRLGAEIVLWSSEEFGFLELATRSARARASCRRRRTPTRPSCCARRRPRVAAHFGGPARRACTRLPLAYNKDMQEDKEHLFDAVDTLELCLEAAAGHAAHGDASTASGCEAAAADEFLAATDIADLLVRRGVPFRESHGIVGGPRAPCARGRASSSPS